MESKKLFKKISPFAVSIALIVISLVIVILTIVDIVTNISSFNVVGTGIAIIICAILYALGIIFSIESITIGDSLFTKEFGIAIASFVGGVLMSYLAVTSLTRIIDVLITVLSVALLIAGTISLIKAIILIIKKEKVNSIIIAFILFALTIAAGILGLVPSTQGIVTAIVFFLLAGALMFVGIYGLVKAVKEMKKEEK